MGTAVSRKADNLFCFSPYRFPFPLTHIRLPLTVVLVDVEVSASRFPLTVVLWALGLRLPLSPYRSFVDVGVTLTPYPFLPRGCTNEIYD